MPEPLRSFSRTRWVRWSGLLAAFALACLGMARVPLEHAPAVESLTRELSARLGAEVRFAALRADPLGAAGFVVRDLEIDAGGWTLSVPRAVWRPGLAGGLARGRLHASAFEISLTSQLGHFQVPEIDARLVGGRLRLEGHGALLERVEVSVHGEGGERRLEVSGRRNAGGRLDLRARHGEAGRLLVDLFPEALALGELELPGLAGHALPGLDVEGHWRVELDPDGGVSHRFDVALVGGDDGPTRADLRARGRVRTRAMGAEPHFVPGSEVVVRGRLRHEVPGLQVSGPVEARLELVGPLADPHRKLALELDGAHLSLGDHLRKPVGLRARLLLDAEPAAGAGITRLAVTLGDLRARATRHGSGAFEGESDWVDLAGLARWLPGLEGHVAGGRGRLRSLRLASRQDFEVGLELDAAQLDGLGEPVAVSGAARLTAEGFDAPGLLAEWAGIALRLDLAGRRGVADEPFELSFAARAEGLELAGIPALADPGEAALLDALFAAAEPPVLRLHEQRQSLSRIAIRSGHVEIGRLQAGSARLRDLHLDLTLRSLRLELPRVAFRGASGEERYSGSIDFNSLLPEVRFAAAP